MSSVEKLIGFIIRHALLVSLAGLILGGVGLYYSIDLYKNLRPDIEELLPRDTRSVKDFEEVASRLKSVESLVIIVTSQDTKASKRFVDDLAVNLRKAPKEVISLVTYRTGDEVEFLKAHQALFVELSDLEMIKKYVSDRLQYEKDLAFNIFPEKDLPPKPTLDTQALKEKYSLGSNDFSRFPDGYYATPDEKLRMVLCYRPGKGLESAHRMRAEIDKAVAATNPKSYAPDLEVQFTGNVENLVEESDALVADLEFSTVVCFLLVTLSLFVFYRSIRATVAIIFALFIGTFWTFGLAYFLVSYLNANTAFLASIVIGNGINFGIMLVARYLEERRRGLENDEALQVSMRFTAPATVVAASAAGISYGSLMLTSFRGFNQFGIIGLTGMLLCWLSSYTILPAALTLLDRHSKWNWSHRNMGKSFLSEKIALLISRYPRQIWTGVLISLGLSLVAFVTYQPGLVETDLSKLKDKRSMSQGSGALYHWIDDVFGHSLSPLAILPHTREDADKIAKRLRDLKKSEGPTTNISTIQTMSDFIPPDQEKKVQVLASIRNILKPSVMQALDPEDRKALQPLTETQGIKTFTVNDVPSGVFERFREVDGSIGKIVLFDKKIDKTGKDDAPTIINFIKKARQETDAVAPNVPVAGELAIIADMLDSITTDGPRVALLAFLSVTALVIVLFRERRTILTAIFALLLGVIWMVAIMLAFRLKLNFLNFIALPITFGIGVDYGVNIFQRWRQQGGTGILECVRHVGGAVMLCSLTTIIGYGSLLMAGNQAFVSFGTLAVLGEFTCIIAAIVALPAYLFLRDQKMGHSPRMKARNLSAKGESVTAE